MDFLGHAVAPTAREFDTLRPGFVFTRELILDATYARIAGATPS